MHQSCGCGYTNVSMYQILRHKRTCSMAFINKHDRCSPKSTNALKSYIVLTTRGVKNIKTCPTCQMDLSQMVLEMKCSHLHAHQMKK